MSEQNIKQINAPIAAYVQMVVSNTELASGADKEAKAQYLEKFAAESKISAYTIARDSDLELIDALLHNIIMIVAKSTSRSEDEFISRLKKLISIYRFPSFETEEMKERINNFGSKNEYS